jgi:formylglycine-generating enzyme required for sulfatase activity
MGMAFVPVGDPGNGGELSGEGAGGFGPDRICGAVGYPYSIGRFEVTAGQYVEFLNAVAATDTYGLYNPAMWTEEYGCRIERSGAPGGYTYSVTPERANRPVNFVSWSDAARFCNWMTNGQSRGKQDLETTEDGSYSLRGAKTVSELQAITRRPNARYVIPSEDEWYKAAYYDSHLGAYFDYATGSNSKLSNRLIAPDPGNNANFRACTPDGVLTDYTVGSPYWMTEVGAFTNSASPYGTFDQNGNVWEWNEAVIQTTRRGVRGGAFNNTLSHLRAAHRGHLLPTDEHPHIGFRVVELPPGKPGPDIKPVATIRPADARIIIDIEAMIDGKDLLIIRDNMMQWHHKDYAMVGRYEGYNEPTIISTTRDGSTVMNRVGWMPRWPEGASVRQEAVSCTFLGLEPALPRAAMKVELTPLKCRGSVQIRQHPSAGNDYTLIVEFDDNKPLGFDWYKVRLMVSDVDLSGAMRQEKPEPGPEHPIALPEGFIAPKPYRSFDDSPFKGISFKWFHLEDCEDGRVNTPGVTMQGGCVDPPHQSNDNNNDSVDGDDGKVDGFGRRARGYYAAGSRKITCRFDQRKLGGFPSHAGIVWTDAVHVSRGKEGYGDVYFEAFDGDGVSLGKVGPVRLGDGRSDGMTEEDRFFGVVCRGGISAITISMPDSGDWEVDHLQYGLQDRDSGQTDARTKRPAELFDDVVYSVRRNWTADFERTFRALEPVPAIPLLTAVCGKPFSLVPEEYLTIQKAGSSAVITKLGGAGSYEVCVDIPVVEGTRALLKFRAHGPSTPVPYFGVRDGKGHAAIITLFSSFHDPDAGHEILFVREDNWVAARFDGGMVSVARLDQLEEPVRMYFHMNDTSKIILEEVRVGHSDAQVADVMYVAGRG